MVVFKGAPEIALVVQSLMHKKAKGNSSNDGTGGALKGALYSGPDVKLEGVP